MDTTGEGQRGTAELKAIMMIDYTHDAAARSWLESANAGHTPFPIHNLPLGCIEGRISVAIGDSVLALPDALERGLLRQLSPPLREALRQPTLNAVFALGRSDLRALRHELFELFREDSEHRQQASTCLRPLASSEAGLPCAIGDYTDFFASLNHARNTFAIFRGSQTFLPNYKHVPIAYHGRSSSIFASPRDFARPSGQVRPAPDEPPIVSPTAKLDFEVELGFWVGAGSAHGEPVPLDEAEKHLAGVCILNDWSARDIQAWESQPLGPFLSKNFISVVSPWVVTMDALEPFRSPLPARAKEDPPPQPYLDSASNSSAGAFSIRIETRIQTERMRALGHPPAVVAHANAARDLYWTPAQMVAHHTIGGCNLRPGDLIGTGTVSGPEPGTEGSLLERTGNGARPITLPGGETRSFLEDGDEVTITAWCEAPGRRSIGLGECRGRILDRGTRQ